MTIKNVSEGFKLHHPSTIMSVPDFFKKKHIFITGATGFMGKVLVEKLLWSCEDIGNIYILIRNKKGVSPSERIKKFITLPAFERLRLNNPSVLSKIIPISGDVMEEHLGISDEDRLTLETNVSVIYHAASSVRFNDPIKKAILLNVRGTREVVELAKNCKILEVMTYVSTSYCNSDKEIIEERVYPADYDWNTMIKLAENKDEHILNILQPKILANKPNTYTFTKQLAENIIHDYSKEIPSLIFRPSIVTFSIEEPIPGYTDNLNGPVGLSAAVLSGVIHVLYGDMSRMSDFIPCDYAIKGLIVSTWFRGISNTSECQVINGASGKKKQQSIDFISQFKCGLLDLMPPSKMMWFPTFIVTTNKLVYNLMVLFTHLLPGFFLDLIFRMKGVNFSLMKIYRKIFIANQALSYFMMNEWKIHTDKYDSLRLFLLPRDKINFDFDIEKVSEKEALNIGIVGMKRFIFKDDISEKAVAADKRKCIRLFWVDRISRGIFFTAIFWIVMKFIMRQIDFFYESTFI